MRLLLYIALIVGLGISFPAFSQEEDPNGAFEFWSRMNVKMKIKNLQHDFEFQYRDQQKVSALQERFHLYTFRWYIQKRWNNFYIQGSPVTFFERQTLEKKWVNEFRLTQLAGYFFLKDRIQLRTGFEERFFWSEAGNTQEIRWRSRILFSVPVSSRLSAQFSDEFFLHKRTSGPSVPVFDQNRSAAGIEFKATKNWSVSTGYQFHIRSFAEHETDEFNVFFLYLNYTL